MPASIFLLCLKILSECFVLLRDENIYLKASLMSTSAINQRDWGKMRRKCWCKCMRQNPQDEHPCAIVSDSSAMGRKRQRMSYVPVRHPPAAMVERVWQRLMQCRRFYIFPLKTSDRDVPTIKKRKQRFCDRYLQKTFLSVSRTFINVTKYILL